GGSLHHQPAHVTDIMATCLNVAGAEYPKTYRGNAITPLEGRTLLPTFEGRARQGHDAYYWEHEGSRAVRKDKWKLVSMPPKDTWELYDLEADRTETNDLASVHPDTAKNLQRMYQAWADRVGVVPPAQLARPTE